jgi:hypothetical protein
MLRNKAFVKFSTGQSDYVSGHGGRGCVLNLSIYPNPYRALTYDIYRSACPASRSRVGVGLHRLLSVPFAAAT